MDETSAYPGPVPLKPNPVTQRAHRKEVLLQILLPIFIILLLIGAGVNYLIQSELASIERWTEISTIILTIISIILFIIPLVIALVLIFVISSLLSILPIYALQTQLAIERVKHQIRTGADISVQPLIQIQSFLAMVDTIFGRRK